MYRNGLKNGFGKFRWADGNGYNIYAGNFVNGKMDGDGKLIKEIFLVVKIKGRGGGIF